MGDKNDHSKESNIKSTINAVKGLAEAVPVYNDVVQPAAKEVGKSLVVVAKTVNIALAPVSALVWGFERIKEFVHARVSEKLKDVPEEKIITPDPAIVGPSLEALRYSGSDSNLRELYASLIATAMDADRISSAHPAFVEIIKNLSSEEAMILNYLQSIIVKEDAHPLLDILVSLPNSKGERVLLRNISLIGINAGIKNYKMTPNYINNLCRLGLMEIPAGVYLADEKGYSSLMGLEEVISIKRDYELLGGAISFRRKYIVITSFGRQFFNACIGPEILYIQL